MFRYRRGERLIELMCIFRLFQWNFRQFYYVDVSVVSPTSSLFIQYDSNVNVDFNNDRRTLPQRGV